MLYTLRHGNPNRTRRSSARNSSYKYSVFFLYEIDTEIIGAVADRLRTTKAQADSKNCLV